MMQATPSYANLQDMSQKDLLKYLVWGIKITNYREIKQMELLQFWPVLASF